MLETDEKERKEVVNLYIENTCFSLPFQALAFTPFKIYLIN